MAYERQLQEAMERLDQSLARLHNFISKGEQQKALQFMTEGELKDRFGELQNMVTISSTTNFGARGVQNTGTF